MLSCDWGVCLPPFSPSASVQLDAAPEAAWAAHPEAALQEELPTVSDRIWVETHT